MKMRMNLFLSVCILFVTGSLADQKTDGYNYPDHPPPAYPEKECKYKEDTPWSDCDPFEFIRWRILPLISGSNCEPKKNETKQCGPDMLPTGTKWLLAEHKKCISELEHLKDIIGDLHRWVDLIHEKGQSMFVAFNELKKHLEDIQQQILGLHRVTHDNEVIINRLKKELEEWKDKAHKFRMELDDIRTKYTELERQHSKMRREYATCSSERSKCLGTQDELDSKITAISTENRELKTQLINAERYKDLVEKARKRLKNLEREVDSLVKEIEHAKQALAQCKVDVVNAKLQKAPEFIKDTHVDLGMTMFITHNRTKIKSTYKPYKYTTTTYETTTYKKYYPTTPTTTYSTYSTTTTYTTTTTTTTYTTTTYTTTTYTTTTYTTTSYTYSTTSYKTEPAYTTTAPYSTTTPTPYYPSSTYPSTTTTTTYTVTSTTYTTTTYTTTTPYTTTTTYKPYKAYT